MEDNKKVELINWYSFREHQDVVQEVMDKAANKKLVLVIGDTGSGKSTTINRLLGVNLVLADDVDALIPDPNFPDQVIPCPMGKSNKQSCTIIPQLIKANDSELTYVDCPGFMHVKSGEEEASSVATTVPIILQSGNVQGIIVLFEYGFSQKGQAFRDALDRLAALLPLEQLKGRLFFVFTKVTNPRVAVVKREINEQVKNTVISDLINDNNLFLIKVEDNPNVDNIKHALIHDLPVEPLSSDIFKLDLKGPKIASDFYDFYVLLQAELAQYKKANLKKTDLSKLIQKIYESMVGIANDFHLVYSKQVHLPNISSLCGGVVKKRLGKLLQHYIEGLAGNDKFPSDDFEKIITNLCKLRDLFDQHFKSGDDQLAFLEILISSLIDLRDQRREVVIGDVDLLADKHKRIVVGDSALTKLRHIQHDVVAQSSYKDNNGLEISATLDTALCTKLSDVLDDFSQHNSYQKLHRFTGWMLKQYSPGSTFELLNPLLFTQFCREMITCEQDPEISQNISVDPHNVALDRVCDVLSQNQLLIEELQKDEKYFGTLVAEYHTCLQNVLTSQNAYITDYQNSVVNPLSQRYSGGDSGLTPMSVKLLDNPTTFINAFNGLTINRITGGLTGTRVASRYEHEVPNYTRADLSLTLLPDPLYVWLRGNVPKELLAAEYLELISFTKAEQTAEVYHPVIPYTRGPDGHVTSIMRSVRDDFHKGDDGITGPHGAGFIDTPYEWSLPISLYVDNTRNAIYTMQFDGSYADISVNATFWRRSESMYSDPGGTAGYHYKLRNELAQHVRRKWESRSVTFVQGAQHIATPSVSDWFLGHRRTIGAALINKTDASRVDLINDYKAKLLLLDIAVLKLKLYALLIGKNPSIGILSDLINSTKIAADITTNKELVNQSDLTPCITSALANKITAKQVVNLPVTKTQHADRMYDFVSNLLLAQRVWRVFQQPLPGLEVISPQNTIELIKFLTNLSRDSEKVKLKYRPFLDLHSARLASTLRQLKHLKRLSLKKLDLNTERMWSNLNAIEGSVKNLEKLDISRNPCEDVGELSLELREMLLSLILHQKKLVNLNVSHTKLGTNFLKMLSLALVKDPALEKLNLIEINPCNDDVALEFLAALCVNTTLHTCWINGSSVSVIIADAIDYIMKVKEDSAIEIPPTLPERLKYFSDKLKIFLDSRAPVVAGLDMRIVFDGFDLVAVANKLVSDTNNHSVDKLVRSVKVIAPVQKKLSDDRKAYIGVLQKQGFLKKLSDEAKIAKLVRALDQYDLFCDNISAQFGLIKQRILGDGNCQFRSIASQILQLYGDAFPDDLAALIPVPQRNLEGITAILRHLAADYIEAHKPDYVGFFAEPCPEYDYVANIDDYIAHLRNDGVWSGELTLLALSRVLNRDIYVMHPNMFDEGVFQERRVYRVNHNADFRLGNAIVLLYNGYNHYETITRRPPDGRLERFIQAHWNDQVPVNNHDENRVPAATL